MRPGMPDLEPAVGQDALARGGQLDGLAAVRVALAPAEEEGLGRDDLGPAGEIGVALVLDVDGAVFQGRGAQWACAGTYKAATSRKVLW